MKIYFASDHAGFALKGALIEYVRTLGYEVADMGAHELDPNDDYPDFITPCARAVASDATARGIILGASGQGEAMAANRVHGVRAAVYYGASPRSQTDADGANLDIVASARAHNDANMLALGARFISIDDVKDAAKRFLETPFSGGERHIRRLAKFS